MLHLLVPALAPVIKSLIDRIPDPVARAQAEEEASRRLLDAFMQSNLAQIEVNKAEAGTGAGGWRWGAGWLCVLALGYAWLARPLMAWLLLLFSRDLPALPDIPVELQYTMLTGMLGLAGIRAYDLKTGTRK